MFVGYNDIRYLRFISVLCTVFNNSQEENVPCSVSDKCILSWALVTEMLDLFLLSSLPLLSASYFCFMVIQYFIFLKGGGEITQ